MQTLTVCHRIQRSTLMNTTSNKLIGINSNDLTNDNLINGNDSGVTDWSDSTLCSSQSLPSNNCLPSDPEVKLMNTTTNKLIGVNSNDVNNDNLINGNDSGVTELTDTPLSLPQSSPQTKSSAQVVLVCRKNSHPFIERRISLEAGQAAKVGRAVARCKPSADNFVFDCKVLSRNHAILSFENQKFFLKDTCSSNGTFVNNQRLSTANEESVQREVFSGDVVQFGVDVTENTRKVTHGCIIATLKLYYPDGTEAQEPPKHCPQNSNQTNVCITSQQLYELSQYLNEAIHREQILENKLETLERVVTSAHESANSGWKSLVEEDRLLSRIETLQNKLEIYLNSQQNSNQSKDNTDGPDISTLQNVRAEVLKLIDDREKYESAAKEAIQRALEEKLVVLTRLHELEISIKSHEEECNRLQEICETSAQEINRLANINDELNKEIESYVKRLKSFEEQKIALIEATNKEREELEEKIIKLKTKEEENNETISELKTLNETASLQIEKLLLQLDVIKQSEKVINDGNNVVTNESTDSTDNTYISSDFKINFEEELKKVKKQLELSNNNCNELSAELNRLKQQTESTVTLTQSSTASMIESNTSSIINGQILSTNKDNTDLNDGTEPLESVVSATVESVISATEASAQQSEQTTKSSAQQSDQTTPLDQITSQQLSSEIDLLKELLAETRASKKCIEEELSRTVTELENLRSLTKQMSLESDESQEKIKKSVKESEEKSVLITTLKNQINDLKEKIRNSVIENDSIKYKIGENDKLLHLKDDELSSLRVLLEEERKVQQKYANNYEQCRKQLSETQSAVKQSQTESELLRKKVYSRNEELRTSRSNLSVSSNTSDELQTKQKELEKLQNECHCLKNKLQSCESELISYRTQHQKLSADYHCLQNSMQLLQKINSEIEQRGDNYWREQFNTAKTDAQTHQTQLTSISRELEELRQKFDDCSKDKDCFSEELLSAKEDIEVFSYQSKIATACAVVPLFMLLIAVLMAYYPSVSTITGTTDL